MRIRVEVADTPYKLATGLMNRHSLAADAGMLFVFPRAQVLNFWGESTFIPLDIAFVNDEGKIAKVARIEKLSRKHVSSDVRCVMAVEVNKGFFGTHNIEVGDGVEVGEDKYEGTFVSFQKNAGGGQGPAEKQVKLSGKNRRWDNRIALIFSGQTKLAKPQGGWSWNNQTPSPFMQQDKQIPVPDWMDDAFNGYEEEGVRPGQGQGQGNVQQDGADLPVIGLDDIGYADDDYDDEYGHDQQQGEDAVEPSQPGDEDEVPDASGMSTYDALEEAISNGYVMQITYTTAPKKRTIGPLTAPKTITRTVQPHGVIHARTTGNNVLVTWDMSVNDYRAFIVDRISDKEFTGKKFKKWFRVEG